VLDDTATGGFQFSGPWQVQTNLFLAHNRTLSVAGQKGATAEVRFQGRRVVLFAKLGADCGRALVRLDDAVAETVDTYSADDIWGVGVYRKELAGQGPHTLRLEVTGDSNPRSKGTLVHLDGLRIEVE
jgi:hypothetical protein